MAGFSDYLENALLGHIFGSTTYTKPASRYVALYTAAPSDAGGGTEVSGGSYARQEVTFGSASGGSISNSAEVLFPVATGSWGTITHFAIFDATTAGNMLGWGALQTAKTVNTDDQLKFPAGNLTITLD